MVAAPDVRRFIAKHGGDLYVWVSIHGWGFFRTALLEAATERPQKQGLFFRRLRVRGFDLQLEADRHWWPKTLELELCGHGKRMLRLLERPGWLSRWRLEARPAFRV